MTGFPGQLTQHSLNAGQTFAWTLAVPFYLTETFPMKVRRIANFQLELT